MKRFLLTLMVLMVSITAAFAAAYTGSCGTNVTYTLDTETGVLKIEGTGAMTKYASTIVDNKWITTAPWGKYSKYVTSVVIGDGVTSIGDYAFSSCKSISEICIPESVTKVGEYAFEACSSMTSITIPESITSIESGAFSDCTGLTSITIPESITVIETDVFASCTALTSVSLPSSLECISNVAFFECSSLSSITIPEGVTKIGDAAFHSCSSLKELELPNSITDIGTYAFYNCSSLTSITIPEGVTSIGEYTFSECYSLSSVTIPSGMKSIGYGAFWDCTSLSAVSIPSGVTTIDDRVFYNCYFLKENFQNNSKCKSYDNWGATFVERETEDGLLISNNVIVRCRGNATCVNIPKNVTAIERRAFENCISLTSVDIPTNVASIGESAFQYCSSLSSVVIHTDEVSINKYAFSHCPLLTNVTCLASNPPSCYSSSFGTYGTLHVLPGCGDAYRATDYWNNFNIVEDAVMPQDYLLGDVNEDGIVSIADLVALVAYLEGHTPEDFNMDAADADENGEIDINDIQEIVSLILKR